MAATRPARPAGPGSVQCGTCGTVMAAGNAYCFECGAPVGAIPTSGEPTVRMQDAEAPPPKRMSLAAKILIVLGILVLGSCGSCIACIVYGYKQLPNIEIQNAQDSLKLMPPGAAALMPPDEAAFCRLMDETAKAAKDAGGSKASAAQIEHLIQEREGKLASVKVQDWIGTMVTRGEMNMGPRTDAGPPASELILGVQTPCGPLFVNGPILGATAGTGIPTGTPLAEAAYRVNRFGTLRFSGELVRTADGHLSLNNLTPAGKLQAPRFLLQFTTLRAEDTGRGAP